MTLPYPLNLWVEKNIPLDQFPVAGIVKGTFHDIGHRSQPARDGTLADLTGWCKPCVETRGLSYYATGWSADRRLTTLNTLTECEATLSGMTAGFDADTVTDRLHDVVELERSLEISSSIPELQAWIDDLSARTTKKYADLRAWVSGVGREPVFERLSHDMTTSSGVRGMVHQFELFDQRFLVERRGASFYQAHQALMLLDMIEPGPTFSGRLLALCEHLNVLASYARVLPSDTDEVLEHASALLADQGEFDDATTALNAARAL